MESFMHRWLITLVLVLATSLWAESPAEFTIADYNVENWNSVERQGKPNQPKPQAERDGVINVILKIRPDVLAMQEMGKPNDLAELTDALRARGLDYPYQEWIQGADADRHVCLVSRFPIVARNSATNDTYLVDGKPMPVQRGFVDVLIKVNDQYSFRAIVAHLKSKRRTDVGDQATMRFEEAKLLRTHIDNILKASPSQNIIAMGDFNDTPDSEAIQAILKDPNTKFFPLRPVDSDGKDGTHFWRTRGEFSRIDYLITSPGMSNEYVRGTARIADVDGWKEGSDHRMIYARFYTRDLDGTSAPAAGQSIPAKTAVPTK
jgi:endonuclease/exonuclease/phosphatase family metal-dependent hydrolase